MLFKVYYAKLPTFLDIKPKPFIADEYIPQPITSTESENLYRLKLKVQNTIRWRYEGQNDDGAPRMESNSRLIRWSDGTFSLLLGDEMYAITTTQQGPNEQNYLLANEPSSNLMTSQLKFNQRMTINNQKGGKNSGGAGEDGRDFGSKLSSNVVSVKNRKKEVKVKLSTLKDLPDTNESAMAEVKKSRSRMQKEKAKYDRKLGSRSIYEDEEEDYRKDEENRYEEDDFVVGSDEESEAEKQREEKLLKHKKSSTSKSSKPSQSTTSSKKRSKNKYNSDEEDSLDGFSESQDSEESILMSSENEDERRKRNKNSGTSNSRGHKKGKIVDSDDD